MCITDSWNKFDTVFYAFFIIISQRLARYDSILWRILWCCFVRFAEQNNHRLWTFRHRYHSDYLWLSESPGLCIVRTMSHSSSVPNPIALDLTERWRCAGNGTCVDNQSDVNPLSRRLITHSRASAWCGTDRCVRNATQRTTNRKCISVRVGQHKAQGMN